MPTKPNRAGQQQNYVPQGNGDASGEYADHASGSNIHFTNFKQPEQKSFSSFSKEPKQENKQPEQPPAAENENSKYLGGSKEKSDFSSTIQSSGFSKYGDEKISQVKSIIESANEECIGILNYTIMNHKVNFIEDRMKASTSYLIPATNEIYIKELDRGFDKPGDSMFHELGHYLNANNKVREREQWYDTNKMLTDAKTLFDDGKSFAETLQEEIKEFSAAGYPPKIRKDKSKFMEEKCMQHGFSAKEYEKSVDKTREVLKTDAEWLDIKDKLKTAYDNGEFESMDSANRKLQEELAIWKKTGSHKELFAFVDEHRADYRNAVNDYEKQNGIRAISDVWSSKSDFGFGFGHDRSYYRKSWANPDPESRVADELFANLFGAMATHDNAVLETTKKYFPRTYEKMLKLIEHVKGKKAQYDEMQDKIAKFQRGEQI